METVIVSIDGRITWKGPMPRQLKRNDKIDIGNAIYRVVIVKIESGIQTALVSSRLVANVREKS